MQEIIAIDFETTGNNPGYNSLPWQIGMVVLRDGKVCPEEQFCSFLHVPEDYPFNQYVPGRWASVRKELAEAPTLIELWPVLAKWLSGRYLMAHNVPVEKGILQSFFPLHNFTNWLDSLTIARKAFPKQNSYKLEDLIANLGLYNKVKKICPDREAHDALYDAIACASLFEQVLTDPGWKKKYKNMLAK